MRTAVVLSAAVMAAPAAGVSYVSITDDDVGYTVELPEGFEITTGMAYDPTLAELAEGKPSAVSAYVWRGTELEGMGFLVIRIGDGGVPLERMKAYVDKQLDADIMVYEITDLELPNRKVKELGADSGTGVQYKSDVQSLSDTENYTAKTKIYYLHKGDASYLVLFGRPIAAGFAEPGEHIEKTFRLK